MMDKKENKKNTINERFGLIMKKSNLNYRSFSKQVSSADTVIANIVKGRNKPSFDLLEKVIINFPFVDIKWLMTGKGEMLVKQFSSVGEAMMSSADDSEDKDEIIKVLRETIEVQKDYISVLKNQVENLKK